MLIEVDSLDLMSTIAEFCVYRSGICIKFPSAFMSYDQVSSPLLSKQTKTLAYIQEQYVTIMQFSVFHSFGPVFCLVKLCRH